MVDDLLEPLKVYNTQLKEEHYQNTIKYFNELVEKSGINVEENKKTIADYKLELNNLDVVNKKLSKYRGIRTFLIILMIILLVAAIITFFIPLEVYLSVILLIAAVGIDIGLLIIIIRVLIKKIKSNDAIKAQLEQKINQLKNLAWTQMQSLNLLYDWNIPATIINRSNSLIKMDKYFDAKKFQYLHEKFGFTENTDQNVSSYFVQSGSILGNPFLICKDYHQDWIDKIYTGSITIYWTERVRTKDGWKTVSRSQVLSASITRPAPVYNYSTYLVYGNDAAPKLTFSRNPSGINSLSEKEITKKIKKDVKKLDKQAKEDLMDGDPTTNYVRFGNDEFESIFGGTDRDNEIEYRLLFTPLAQRNLLDLLKNAEPYGDDFYFDKIKKLNYVQSIHSQKFDYKADPEMFVHFDYEAARERFINYNVKFFESFFFDIAPVISIPLYQQMKSAEYIYESEYEANITSFEHESLANSFDINLLKHPKTDTSVILKTQFERKEGLADKVKITAHSFEAIPRVEYVTQRGGDGKLHTIPIHWFEYLPLEQENYMAVESRNSTRLDYINHRASDLFKIALLSFGSTSIYQRGLFAALITRDFNTNDIGKLNEAFRENIEEISTETLRNKINNAINIIKNKVDDARSSTNSSVVDTSTNIQDSDSSSDTSGE